KNGFEDGPKIASSTDPHLSNTLCSVDNLINSALRYPAKNSIQTNWVFKTQLGGKGRTGMTRHWSQVLPIVLGVSTISFGAEAQPPLTAVILHGASTRPGSAQPGTPTMLTPGVRIESPRTSWTEIAFSDGSSVVLDPGADFTLQGVEKDPESGHLAIPGAS